MDKNIPKRILPPHAFLYQDNHKTLNIDYSERQQVPGIQETVRMEMSACSGQLSRLFCADAGSEYALLWSMEIERKH